MRRCVNHISTQRMLLKPGVQQERKKLSEYRASQLCKTLIFLEIEVYRGYLAGSGWVHGHSFILGSQVLVRSTQSKSQPLAHKMVPVEGSVQKYHSAPSVLLLPISIL